MWQTVFTRCIGAAVGAVAVCRCLSVYHGELKCRVKVWLCLSHVLTQWCSPSVEAWETANWTKHFYRCLHTLTHALKHSDTHTLTHTRTSKSCQVWEVFHPNFLYLSLSVPLSVSPSLCLSLSLSVSLPILLYLSVSLSSYPFFSLSLSLPLFPFLVITLTFTTLCNILCYVKGHDKHCFPGSLILCQERIAVLSHM